MADDFDLGGLWKRRMGEGGKRERATEGKIDD
jgi:hypothetical protein